MGFLSTAGGDPGMELTVYIQDILQMGEQTTVVLKVSTGAKPGNPSTQEDEEGSLQLPGLPGPQRELHCVILGF